MSTKTLDPTATPSGVDLDRQNTLQELIEKQGVLETATFGRLLGVGAELWDNDAAFERFLESIEAIRQEKE